MNFQDYWVNRGCIDYDSMVEASAAFEFQQSRVPMWSSAIFKRPPPEEQCLVIIQATKEQLSIDKECCKQIFAAIDPDNENIWYDWSSGQDIDTRFFRVTKWILVDELMAFLTVNRKHR